ncbi:hypothetical protein LTR53_001166 [Teratosphaeriaceae sp. CCFEE 6253]|nr:hypothetical protein LTR53_001166 [Teratosphaeriaceae sp. CCFEE 6253]
MADGKEFKIKGAAEQSKQLQQAEETEQAQEEKAPGTHHESSVQDSDPKLSSQEDGEIPEASEQPYEPEAPVYNWCKIFHPPQQDSAPSHYFMHFATHETKTDEPTEPYWIWDAVTNNVHASGLQQPSNTTDSSTPAAGSSEPKEEEYQGYIPSKHGNYDPNAPYAKWHDQKRAEEAAIAQYGSVAAAQQVADYAAVANFNRVSGGFQTADRTTERHSDFNKSGRQMNAFFDIEAAANSHEGKSLKEERRNQKLSKKEVAELNKKRKDRKEKKRLDFYKS